MLGTGTAVEEVEEVEDDEEEEDEVDADADAAVAELAVTGGRARALMADRLLAGTIGGWAGVGGMMCEVMCEQSTRRNGL